MPDQITLEEALKLVSFIFTMSPQGWRVHNVNGDVDGWLYQWHCPRYGHAVSRWDIDGCQWSVAMSKARSGVMRCWWRCQRQCLWQSRWQCHQGDVYGEMSVDGKINGHTTGRSTYC